MLSPSKHPGARGSASMLPGQCGARTFPTRPPAWLFVLNCAAEQELLPEIFRRWAQDGGAKPAACLVDIPLLADAVRQLAAGGLIAVYRDPLEGDELRRLCHGPCLSRIADERNWWLDEDDPDVPPASSLIVIDITAPGQRTLSDGDWPAVRGALSRAARITRERSDPW
jgi:hypothetical protein